MNTHSKSRRVHTVLNSHVRLDTNVQRPTSGCLDLWNSPQLIKILNFGTKEVVHEGAASRLTVNKR